MLGLSCSPIQPPPLVKSVYGRVRKDVTSSLPLASQTFRPDTSISEVTEMIDIAVSHLNATELETKISG